MAILMILEVPGATLDAYERANEIMGVHGDDSAPDGLISHTAGATEDGIIAVDVWESEEALQRFFETQLGAALKEAGIPEGKPRILPVHNMIAQGAGTNPGVLAIIEMDGFSSTDYDRLAGGMDAHIADGSNHPAVSHVAATTDGGLVVVDVWDSPESFGRFAETQIGPAGAEAGIGPLEIEPRFVPVHNRIRGKVRQAS